MEKRTLAALVAAFLAAGCAELLPKSSSEVTSGWRSFEEARGAIERIVPGQTTSADLEALGIDLYHSPNVQLLTFSDIVLRFPLSIAPDRLDAGLRQCLEAGKECNGYSISVRDVKRDRVGGFWEDALGFKRIVDVSGWNFNALLLMVDGRVVYTLHGGQPNLREQEIVRQPLGPVQNFGGALPLGSIFK